MNILRYLKEARGTTPNHSTIVVSLGVLDKVIAKLEAGERLAEAMRNMPQPHADRTGVEWLMWRDNALAKYEQSTKEV